MSDFRSAGDNLVGILDMLGCGDHPRVGHIQKKTGQISDKFQEIQDTLAEKQHTLNAAVVESQVNICHIPILCASY